MNSISSIIRQEANVIGFTAVGFSTAAYLEEDAPRLENWLKSSMHGEMKYMENYFDMRLDPRILVPEAKTVISFLYNYYSPSVQKSDVPIISRYAYGNDYHFVIKEKLRILNQTLIEKHNIHLEGRVFTDSAPILERSWAVKSGLGWVGKNGNLINKKNGSYFFLAEWITPVEVLENTIPSNDYCGTCNACIKACPTEAILPGKVIEAHKCISYLTIELKQEIPQELDAKLNDRLFGCDICQEVCPWNRFSIPHKENLFNPVKSMTNMTRKDWIELTRESFNQIFKNSALKRTGYQRLMKNLEILQRNRTRNKSSVG